MIRPEQQMLLQTDLSGWLRALRPDSCGMGIPYHRNPEVDPGHPEVDMGIQPAHTITKMLSQNYQCAL